MIITITGLNIIIYPILITFYYFKHFTTADSLVARANFTPQDIRPDFAAAGTIHTSERLIFGREFRSVKTADDKQCKWQKSVLTAFRGS